MHAGLLWGTLSKQLQLRKPSATIQSLLGRAVGVLLLGLVRVEQRQANAVELMAAGGPEVAGVVQLQVTSRLVRWSGIMASACCCEASACALPALAAPGSQLALACVRAWHVPATAARMHAAHARMHAPACPLAQVGAELRSSMQQLYSSGKHALFVRLLAGTLSVLTPRASGGTDDMLPAAQALVWGSQADPNLVLGWLLMSIDRLDMPAERDHALKLMAYRCVLAFVLAHTGAVREHRCVLCVRSVCVLCASLSDACASKAWWCMRSKSSANKARARALHTGAPSCPRPSASCWTICRASQRPRLSSDTSRAHSCVRWSSRSSWSQACQRSRAANSCWHTCQHSSATAPRPAASSCCSCW